MCIVRGVWLCGVMTSLGTDDLWNRATSFEAGHSLFCGGQVAAVQDDIVQRHGHLRDAVIPVEDLHVTLFVTTLREDDGSLEVRGGGFGFILVDDRRLEKHVLDVWASIGML